jgi:hypothetical protein
MPASGGRFGVNEPPPAATITTLVSKLRADVGVVRPETAVAGSAAGHRRAGPDAARRPNGLICASSRSVSSWPVTMRQAGDVVRSASPVELGALAAGLVEDVDDVRLDVEEAELEYRKQADRPGADDHGVRLDGACGRCSVGWHGRVCLCGWRMGSDPLPRPLSWIASVHARGLTPIAADCNRLRKGSDPGRPTASCRCRPGNSDARSNWHSRPSANICCAFLAASRRLAAAEAAHSGARLLAAHDREHLLQVVGDGGARWRRSSTAACRRRWRAGAPRPRVVPQTTGEETSLLGSMAAHIASAVRRPAAAIGWRRLPATTAAPGGISGARSASIPCLPYLGRPRPRTTLPGVAAVQTNSRRDLAGDA